MTPLLRQARFQLLHGLSQGQIQQWADFRRFQKPSRLSPVSCSADRGLWFFELVGHVLLVQARIFSRFPQQLLKFVWIYEIRPLSIARQLLFGERF